MVQTIGDLATIAKSSDAALGLLGYDRPAEYREYALVRDVMVAMRDGVRLATDLYFPAKEGKPVAGSFPVIVDRTPYDKVPRALAANDPEFFARRGYVFVFQDSRGHGKSEGEFQIYLNEGRDGYDLLEWIGRQPWSNGKVGTSGYSYDCATQMALAREGAPNLTAMFPAFGTADYHQDTEACGGAFRLAHNLFYSLHQARMDQKTLADPVLAAWIAEAEEHIYEWFKRPLSKHFSIFERLPNVQRWYRDWVDHQDHDDYWKQNGYYYEGYYDRFADIPMFFYGGLYDFLLRGTMVNYQNLSRLHRSPTYFVLGPSCHGPVRARKTWQGDVDFGPNAYVDWNHLRLAFFDRVLKGMPVEVLNKEPRVRVFVMGGGSGCKNPDGRMEHGGRWVTVNDWPVPGAVEQRLYLHGDGALRPELPASGVAPTTYSYDPNNPCPQIGGNYTYPFSTGPQDQVCRPDILGCTDHLPLESRPDVLSFQTPPLAQGVEVVGPLSVKLYVSSTAVDTDFTAKLIDVYPPNADYPRGYAMILIDSIRRMRYRNSLERAELMTPGEVYEVTIDLWATANRFERGHRIRLDISSSNFPTFDPNPNTGEPIGYHTHTVTARNTVFHDAEHSSHLILPLLPA